MRVLLLRNAKQIGEVAHRQVALLAIVNYATRGREQVIHAGWVVVGHGAARGVRIACRQPEFLYDTEGQLRQRGLKHRERVVRAGVQWSRIALQESDSLNN